MKIAAIKARNAKSVSLGLSLLLAVSICALVIATFSFPVDRHAVPRRRLQSSVAVASDAPIDDPGAYDYLIIHYHKTGHETAYSLMRLIRDDVHTSFKVQHDPLPIREHDETTKCPSMSFRLGMLYVQAAPDFFCDVDVLAAELLRGRDGKKGIKIIHLVRNPFHLAVSNYLYHSQHPPPERWVRGLDVCKEEESPIYPELMMPTLGRAGAMKRVDFDAILQLCNSLFRTKRRLKMSDFYRHLRVLDPVSGLLLATTKLMRGRGGDIARMANNIIKLQQLEQLEARANIAQHRLHPDKRIHVLTLSMDDFIQSPKETSVRFLDFLLGSSTPQTVIEGIAAEYEQGYMQLVNENHFHITQGSSKKAMLETSLREHDLFGTLLGNIEHIVEGALRRG